MKTPHLRTITPRKSFASMLVTLLVVPCAINAQDETEEEIFELSPFEVKSNDDVGYAAQNTLAGSRLNTRLKDTAASLSVFTAEFLDDIGATDIEDAMLYSVNSEIDYGQSGQSVSGGNSILENSFDFRVRGLRGSKARNFFSWNVKSDNYNVGRIDQSRGPNSILFGIGSPGGIMNVSTKKANVRKDSNSINLQIGEDSLRRGSIDINRVLIEDKLAFRLNALKAEDGSYRYFEGEEKSAYHLAVTFKPLEKTTLYAEYEESNYSDTRSRPFTAYDRMSLWRDLGETVEDTSGGGKLKANKDKGLGTNNAKRPLITAIDNEDGLVVNAIGSYTSSTDDSRHDTILPEGSGFHSDSMNITGPGARREMDYNTHTVILQHALTDALNIELAYNHVDDQVWNYDPTNGALRILGDPNSHFTSGEVNPYAGQYYVETNWIRRAKTNATDQYRASASYELKTERVGTHRFAAMYEDRDTNYKRNHTREALLGAPYNNQPENAANRVYRRRYITPGEYDGMYVPDYTTPITWTDPETNETYTSGFVSASEGGNADDEIGQSGFMLTMQNYLFSNRIITTFGYREDDYESLSTGGMRDPDTNMYVVDYDNLSYTSSAAETRTMGIVGHVTQNFSLFYNQSEGVSLGDPNMRVLPFGLVPEPTDDTTFDFGVMAELFEGKLNARLTYFETESDDGADYLGVSGISSRANNVWDTYADAGLITAEERDANNSDIGGGYFDRVADGLEFRLVANLTNNWRLVFNASETNVVESDVFPLIKPWWAAQVARFDELGYVDGSGADLIISDGEDTLANVVESIQEDLESRTRFDGLPAYGNRRYKANLFTKYTFEDSFLKGFSVGGGFRYQDENPAGVEPDGTTIIYGPSYTAADLVMGYKTKVNDGKVKMSIQLNIRNVLDSQEELILRYDPDGGILRNKITAPFYSKLTVGFNF